MIAIAILAFTSIVLVAVGLFCYLHSQQALRERQRRIEGREPGTWESSHSRGTPFLNVFEFLAKLTTPKKPEELSRTRKTLLKAGYRTPHVTAVFYGGKALGAIAFFLFFTFMRLTFLKELSYLQTMVFSISASVIGLFVPDLWIYRKISKRREKILEGLPDVLDLLVICMEAGLGLNMAIKRVGEEIELANPVLSEEFNQIHLELMAGSSREDAMKGFASRTELEEVSSLVTLLIQTERFGTSIAQALRVHADALRTRRRQKAEELAAKMTVKMTFPLILFILPALLLVVVGPGIIKVFRVLLPTMRGG